MVNADLVGGRDDVIPLPRLGKGKLKKKGKLEVMGGEINVIKFSR